MISAVRPTCTSIGKPLPATACANQLGLARLERRHGEPHVRHALVNDPRRLQEIAEVALHFLRPRAGQNRHERPAPRLQLLDERRIELLGRS